MSIYDWNIYQVYRTKKDINTYGGIIPQGMLVQIWKYEGSTISLKSEDDNRYIVNAKELLLNDNFQRVF